MHRVWRGGSETLEMVKKRGNVSLWKLFIHFRDELMNNDLLSESKAVAYNFTVALFPSIIFLSKYLSDCFPFF